MVWRTVTRGWSVTDTATECGSWCGWIHITRSTASIGARPPGPTSGREFSASERPFDERRERVPWPTVGGSIRIRGAREHNLRNVDVELPRDKLIVFTGLSGS